MRIADNLAFLNKERKILFGTIYCPIEFSGDTAHQQDHTVRFMGEYPCDQFGTENKTFVNSPQENVLTPDIVGSFYFSSKPESGNYKDFYDKMTRYINLLSAPAKSIDPSVSAQNFDYKEYSDDNVFKYPDTNSARACITCISDKIKNQKIAIIGLGGTGSYLLDFVSKTPVKQISLFDGDLLLNHNAFRSPGAISIEELNTRPSKVSYFKRKYDAFRDGLVEHEVFINETNLELLDGHDFIFLAIDKAKSKKAIIEYLQAVKIPFVDCGMGLSVVNGSLRGQIRKTLVTPENNSKVNRIQQEKTDDDNIYSQNIQIAELNALNAVLGVITWKKLFGFYLPTEIPYNTSFILDEEKIANET